MTIVTRFETKAWSAFAQKTIDLNLPAVAMISLMLLTVFATMPVSAQSLPWLKGVNLAGAEFGESSLPGQYERHYIYPNADEVDYFKSTGMNVVRIPFRWERIQQSQYAELDPAEVN